MVFLWLVHFDPLVKKMSDANHLSGPVRKQKFTSTGSKVHGFWFVIGGFRSVSWVSVFQGSLLVIVMTINGSEKRNCEGGFWASECVCFWKAQWPAAKEYILQWFIQQNHQRDNTHSLNHKSYLHLTHKVTFALTSKHAGGFYLKASLVPTKHKPIPFTFIHQFLNVFVLFLLILLGCKPQNFCATSPYALDIWEQNRSVLLWPKPDVNIPNIFDRFHPWTANLQISMRLTLSAIKCRAGKAFFPICLLPCTRHSHGRHSPRFACLRWHVLLAYCSFASKQAVSITLFRPCPNNN